MADQPRILLFGDLTFDYEADLSRHVAKKDNPLLTTFFEQVAHALRAHIGSLSVRDRGHKGFVKFSTLGELLARLQTIATRHPALEKALGCVYHFASFINHYSSPGQTYPSCSQTHIIGLCTGLLTGAAVSCCRSLSDLIPVAVHTVIVAFRVGFCVSDVRDRIEPPKGSAPSSWSVLLPGVPSDKAVISLERFNIEKCLPIASRPYISAFAENGVTVSGPPSILQNLLASDYLPRRTPLKMRIHGPYHAAHLYGPGDIDNILEPMLEAPTAMPARMIPLYSSVHGASLPVVEFGPLLRIVLSEILFEPLHLDRICNGIGKELAAMSAHCCTILPIATLTAQTFASSLKRSGLSTVSVDDAMITSSIKTQSHTSRTGNFAHSRLAIVAFSGRYPDADSNDEFWALLREGRDVASEAPKVRWDVKTHVDPTGKKKNTSATPYGCWLQKAGLFDAKFFGISPREAPQVDPAQRLSLLTAYEAVENAGMVAEATPSTQKDRVGVFYGTSSNDWGETNSAQDIDTYYIPGSCRAFIPGKQNYFFKFSGPSISVDTACSSSLAAMHMACNALWRGDIDTAICGGTNVTTNPGEMDEIYPVHLLTSLLDITAGLDRGHFLSRTGNCKTFDDDADGYCRGEGVVTIIIKRLEDAVEDNDPVLAMIEAAYTNHSAEAESITRPHVGAQRAIFERILTSACADPYSVGYVEMHGTGTQAGDAREMESVLATFANPSAPIVRDETQALHLGSVKANVGHGEGVSGVVALAKVLLMLENNEIPPHCGIKTKINTHFPTNLKERNVHIAFKTTPWQRNKDRPRRVLINNFSAAGGNSSVLISDPPVRQRNDQTDPRSTHIVTVSARSKTALSANVESILRYIGHKSPSLPSLSYTTTARRMHHPHRLVANGSELVDISSQLKAKLLSLDHQVPMTGYSRIGYCFTGQGSQYSGMARELLQFSNFRKDYERFNAIASKQGFPSILPILMHATQDISRYGPLVVQLATTCMQMAMGRLWQSWGVEPHAVVGHSLGEYAALNIAGVLSDADTIFLTGMRAQLLEDNCTRNTHAMLAIGSSPIEIKKILESLDFEIACKNTPSETVLSGTNEQIDKIFETVSMTGLKQTRLSVPFAFHSSQVEMVLKDFERIAKGATFHAPKVPVISTLLGAVVTSAGTFGPSYLSRHCREAVDFVGSLAAASQDHLTDKMTWVEIGPHPVVTGLLKANLGPVTVLPTLQRNKDTWKVITGSLATLYTAGADIKWAEYHRDFRASLTVLQLPSYNWDLKDYWMKYMNDWSLYKGDARFLSDSKSAKLSTTSVQKVIEEKTEGNNTTLIVESDLMREDLEPIIRGHRVNGVALCTPSVYADMAITLGEYLRKQIPKLEQCMTDVQHMDVQRPLAAKSKGKGSQFLRARINLDRTEAKATVEFYSVTAEGKKLVKHAECRIAFPKIDIAAAETRKDAPAILRRIMEVRRNLDSDVRVQKLHKSASYKIVASLASYDEEYKGVEEAILDSRNLEAVAKVRFDKPDRTGTYEVHPYIIDCFAQPALFVMNANDTADLEKEVFVNHGWSSLHFYKPVSTEKIYQSYVKMSGPKEDGMYSGDMVVFEDKEVVATFKGVKAQGVPRRLMDYIVHMRDDTKAGPPRLAAKQVSDQISVSVNTDAATVQTDLSGTHSKSNSWTEALTIISEESGVPVSELTGDKAFAELGVDSLLALLCASRFREELGLDYESSIFSDCPTVEELESFWHKAYEVDKKHTVMGNDAILDSMFHDDQEPDSDETASFELIPSSPSNPQEPKISATSLLLQGNPAAQVTTKTLFLLPDGSGSSSSYASLSRVHPHLAIVGMNCPYMKIPEQWNCGIEDVAAMYIEEIRRRQPHGPYAFGGWSVGGIFAYHIAQQLAAEGEMISDLILIDCPTPRGLDHLPKRYYEYCEKIGLLGEVAGVRKTPPQWLIPHFEACVNVLHSYFATRFVPAHKAPNTLIIWACDAIDRSCNPKFERLPDDPEGLKFLTATRNDFGPCGWESLLPESKIQINRTIHANHFTMMRGDHAKQISEMIGIALLG